MRVVLYLRRSTVDLQPDSLDAQEELLRRYAAEEHHEVVHVYRDSASGRRIEGRDAFQLLIDHVKAGPDFKAVLVRDVSRWSRADNTDEAGYYEFICRSHGVAVVYVDESFGPGASPYAILMKSVKRAMAAEFSREKARVVVFSAARVVREGFWPIGAVAYGLRRVLVEADGTVVRSLLPGDRKALASQRVKLCPGDQAEVEVVQRIFRAYALEEQSVEAIAKALNADGVPSSKRSVWTAGVVSYVLRNAAYMGTLVYRIRKGQSPSELLNLRDSDDPRIARCPNAHPAIIDPDLWDAVQKRLDASSHRRTDVVLLAELATARATWRPGRKVPRETVTPSELRCGYGREDREIIGAAVDRAKERLREALAPHLHVTDFEDGWLLEHLLTVGFAVSLPHARFAGLHWDFAFTGEERVDVVLGLAFSPEPLIEHVDTFFFRIPPSARRVRHVYPLLDASKKTQVYARVTEAASLLPRLSHAIRFRGTRAEALLLVALHGIKKVNLEEVATGLGWPVAATRTLYHKLELRGVAVPPLQYAPARKRLTVTCPHCLRPRSLAAEVVLTLDTDVCFECLHRPPLRTPNTQVAVCPTCGAKRLLRPSELASRKGGLASLCRRCSTIANCAAGAAASHARRRTRT